MVVRLSPNVTLYKYLRNIFFKVQITVIFEAVIGDGGVGAFHTLQTLLRNSSVRVRNFSVPSSVGQFSD